MNNKKSVGLSMEIIVVAFIVLVVLVTLIYMFSNFFGKTAENIGSCVTKGGVCANEKAPTGEKPDDKCGEDYPIPLFVSGGCPDSTPKNLCCIKVNNE